MTTYVSKSAPSRQWFGIDSGGFAFITTVLVLMGPTKSHTPDLGDSDSD